MDVSEAGNKISISFEEVGGSEEAVGESEEVAEDEDFALSDFDEEFSLLEEALELDLLEEAGLSYSIFETVRLLWADESSEDEVMVVFGAQADSESNNANNKAVFFNLQSFLSA